MNCWKSYYLMSLRMRNYCLKLMSSMNCLKNLMKNLMRSSMTSYCWKKNYYCSMNLMMKMRKNYWTMKTNYYSMKTNWMMN